MGLSGAPIGIESVLMLAVCWVQDDWNAGNDLSLRGLPDGMNRRRILTVPILFLPNFSNFPEIAGVVSAVQAGQWHKHPRSPRRSIPRWRPDLATVG